MKGNKHMKTITNIIYPAFVVVALASFAVSPLAQAQLPSPAPDGGSPRAEPLNLSARARVEWFTGGSSDI